METQPRILNSGINLKTFTHVGCKYQQIAPFKFNLPTNFQAANVNCFYVTLNKS